MAAHGVGWSMTRGLYKCGRCGHQASVTAGTTFQPDLAMLRGGAFAATASATRCPTPPGCSPGAVRPSRASCGADTLRKSGLRPACAPAAVVSRDVGGRQPEERGERPRFTTGTRPRQLSYDTEGNGSPVATVPQPSTPDRRPRWRTALRTLEGSAGNPPRANTTCSGWLSKVHTQMGASSGTWGPRTLGSAARSTWRGRKTIAATC